MKHNKVALATECLWVVPYTSYMFEDATNKQMTQENFSD